ncbi:MAG: lipopolysaccharide biosynthesis protein [Actinobacteria bacterium]|nr:lipopolysaccharide biosynthesis protein [Actinomycetota bacterium]MBU1493042.1 lipopolysaccharide biosynthesis protein [Actinomycetota bacterium]
MTTTRSSDDLGTTAARAVMWNYASFASGKVLVLVTLAVLARLLTPSEFGIVGFATLALAYLAVLKDLGLGGALIQRRDDTEEAAQTVYTLNLILGVVLTAATILAAPLVAGFFDEPLVTPILRVLSVSFLIEALGSVHLVLLARRLDFRRRLLPDVGRSLVKGAVAITAASLGMGVWALVWGQLAGVAASSILVRLVVPWRPRLVIHRNLVRPLLAFGMPLVIVNIQYAIWSNLDYVVIGRFLGDAALGVYILAYRLPELLVQSVWRVVAGAAFPFFSSLQHDPELLRRGFLKTIRYSQLLVVPLALGLLITAEPTVGAIFGDQWSEAVPVLRILAVFTLVASVGYNAGDVYKAIGKSGILAKLGIVDLLVLAPALIVAAPHGIVAVAWAHAAVSLLDTALRLLVARHFISVSLRDIGRQLLVAYRAGAAMALVAVPVLWGMSGFGNVLALAVTVPAAAATYLGMLARFSPGDLRRILGWVGLGRLVRRRETA